MKQRGHVLLVAIILTTILSLMMAMTLMPVNTASTRAREAELVYRGEHLAEGIRRFYGKFGRFPFELDELIEQEPRFVRQLYKDPMSEDGEWTLVYLTASDRNAVNGLDQTLNRALGQPQQDTEEVNSENVQQQEGRLFTIQRRQITGIRSKSDKEGLRVRDESSIYADWLFTALPKKMVGLGEAMDMLPGGGKGTQPTGDKP